MKAIPKRKQHEMVAKVGTIFISYFKFKLEDPNACCIHDKWK